MTKKGTCGSLPPPYSFLAYSPGLLSWPTLLVLWLLLGWLVWLKIIWLPWLPRLPRFHFVHQLVCECLLD